LLFSSPTEVKLRRGGETIEITADIMEPAHFPAAPLLAALLDAGERLLTIAERLGRTTSRPVSPCPTYATAPA
jgi:hypothetical protein